LFAYGPGGEPNADAFLTPLIRRVAAARHAFAGAELCNARHN
jgi:hypothetical protein